MIGAEAAVLRAILSREDRWHAEPVTLAGAARPVPGTRLRGWFDITIDAQTAAGIEALS